MRTQANFTLLRHLAVLTALLAAAGCGDDMRVADVDLGPPDPVDMGQPDLSEEMICEPGFVDCGDGCTRLAGDSDHCGSCGNACPDGFSCAVGRCDCEQPLKSCDGECTDPSTDINNCGMCGNVCRDGDICLDGACVVDCTAPEQRCPGTDEEFVCADVMTDSANCGVCGAGCSAGATCVDGSCACASGEISCGGSCVDPMTDAERCGNCLTSCGEGGVCMDGACSTCGTGLDACGTPARCTDTDTSRLHCGACGNACAAGEGCNAGVCECLPGFVDCDGECAVLMTDRDHCGACGVDCGPLGACNAGACVCEPEAEMCGAECALLENDPRHCGACDNACGAGEICRGSACLELNATCAAATPITADTTITGEDIADGGSRPMGTGCGFGSGNTALWYAVTVPAGQRVRAVASSSADLVVFSQSDCADSTCLGYSDFPEEITVDNATGATERTFYVGVRGYSSSTTGTYDMAFTYTTPVVASNASCATATPIAAATTITGEDITQGGERPSGTGCGFGSGNTALYYAVEVPAGQRARVVATSSADLVVFAQNACADTTCVAANDFPEEVTVDNALGTSPRTYYVGVRGYSSSTTGTFDLAVTYTTPVVAANASCATATAVDATTTITGETITEGGPRPQGTGCGTSSGNSALYYAVEVPAGGSVAVTTTGTFDRVMLFQDSCGATTCTYRTDSSPEMGTLMNATASPVTRIVAVHNYSSSGSGTFDITFTY
ncbi:MAG: hypothetical protein JJ863_11790 [Deltaproteobacteria bacterium]|nr:hypothetical protein [Deltaproteobacteria bacterium]